jgi:hypothetical protein
MSYPHHPPFLDKKPSSMSIVLEGDPAQHEGKQGCQNNSNGQCYEIDYGHIFGVVAHLYLQMHVKTGGQLEHGDTFASIGTSASRG